MSVSLRGVIGGTSKQFALYRYIGTVRYNSTDVNISYKEWSQLELPEKQLFIREFVKNYKKQFPKSRTNLSLKMLSLDMEKYNDSPSVFGIFYNDIYKELTRETDSNVLPNSVTNSEASRFSHPTFKTLLIRKDTKLR